MNLKEPGDSPVSPGSGEEAEGNDAFRLLADSIPQLAWMADADGALFWYNRRWFDYTGTTLEEMRGWGWRAVHHPDHLERVTARFRAAVAAGEAWEDTFPLRSRTGEYRRFLSRALPLRDDRGRVTRWFGTNTDVEDQLRTEEALREVEERYRLATRAAGEAIWDWDLATDGVRWNDGVCTLFGYPRDEVGAWAGWWKEQIHPDDRGRVVDEIHRAIDGAEEGWTAEYRFRRFDGSYADVMDRGFVLRDGAGRALRMIGSMQDVTARRRHEAGVLAASRAAEAANRAKSQFLATMSHEIRTPINAIIGYADLLEVGVAGELTAQQRAYVDRIRGSSRHLLGLVNDILDLSKVEAGEMTVRRDRLPLRDTATTALDLVRPQAREREITLVEDSDCAAAVAYLGDEERVRQILANLLSNAIKFTPPRGQVTVRCHLVTEPDDGARLGGSGPWTTIEVEDTGIGIAPEEVGRVFEPFVQVDASHTRATGGTGLGLAIARRFARLMGGDLTVRSRLGEGSRFVLWLPAARPDASADAHPAWKEGWPSRAGEVPGLSRLGHLLSGAADGLVGELGERLRSDPAIPGARGLDRAQVENHIATFLLDVGKALVTLDEGGGEPALMRDGESIQRTIARLHGEQRLRLGWSAEEVRREFAIQREMVDRLFTGEAATGNGDDLTTAIGIAHRLLERAEQIALAVFDRDPPREVPERG